jgi:UDP-N-acetylmuramate dehydrogenase
VGSRVPLADARRAVLGLRRGKGMVLDPGDPDTRSAGSFFTNPVLDRRQFAEVQRRAAARLGRPVPHFASGDGSVKIPAAWLIEHAGFRKGYPQGGGARISSKHTLALINPGGASTAGLVALAREIQAGVREAFGVELASEPVLVGAEL